jgi:hypothetical protein
MADTTASQYGLRAHVEPDNRPLGQQTDRQRGMRAAFEVLKGTISPRSAKSKYRVNKDSLRYYKARLVKDGVAETIASVPPPTGGTRAHDHTVNGRQREGE